MPDIEKKAGTANGISKIKPMRESTNNIIDICCIIRILHIMKIIPVSKSMQNITIKNSILFESD